MQSHYVAMHSDGRLFVATRGPLHCPFALWEPCPLTPAGMTHCVPFNAELDVVQRPAWAVDFYRLTYTDVVELVT